jgi:hypothetical protein
MDDLNQPNQNRGYYPVQGPSGGAYGALYIDPANPAISKVSSNFPSAVRARAAAKGACYGATGGRDCNLAIEFHNGCAAMARSGPKVWAARAAVSGQVAAAEAVTACQKAGGASCVVKSVTCSPSND